MVKGKTWGEFRDTGLLWFINTILHTFGWAIVIEIDDATNEIIKCYPARVKFRGFNEENNSIGYTKVSEYLKENINVLLKECKE